MALGADGGLVGEVRSRRTAQLLRRQGHDHDAAKGNGPAHVAVAAGYRDGGPWNGRPRSLPESPRLELLWEVNGTPTPVRVRNPPLLRSPGSATSLSARTRRGSPANRLRCGRRRRRRLQHLHRDPRRRPPHTGPTQRRPMPRHCQHRRHLQRNLRTDLNPVPTRRPAALHPRRAGGRRTVESGISPYAAHAARGRSGSRPTSMARSGPSSPDRSLCRSEQGHVPHPRTESVDPDPARAEA
jgi:hypothetical protein